MILITYQDEAGTVRILAEYDDEVYEAAYEAAEDYFTNGGRLLWLELLLTEMDGDLDTSVCLRRWVPIQPHSLPKHPSPSSSSDKSLFQEIALGIAAAMICVAFLIGLNSYIGSIALEKIHTYQEGGLGYK